MVLQKTTHTHLFHRLHDSIENTNRLRYHSNSEALPMVTTTSVVSFRPWVPKTFFFYAWVFGRLESNVANYVLARLPNFDR
jgi:hypothetical protein